MSKTQSDCCCSANTPSWSLPSQSNYDDVDDDEDDVDDDGDGDDDDDDDDDEYKESRELKRKQTLPIQMCLSDVQGFAK